MRKEVVVLGKNSELVSPSKRQSHQREGKLRRCCPGASEAWANGPWGCLQCGKKTTTNESNSESSELDGLGVTYP